MVSCTSIIETVVMVVLIIIVLWLIGSFISMICSQVPLACHMPWFLQGIDIIYLTIGLIIMAWIIIIVLAIIDQALCK